MHAKFANANNIYIYIPCKAFVTQQQNNKICYSSPSHGHYTDAIRVIATILDYNNYRICACVY